MIGLVVDFGEGSSTNLTEHAGLAGRLTRPQTVQPVAKDGPLTRALPLPPSFLPRPSTLGDLSSYSDPVDWPVFSALQPGLLNAASNARLAVIGPCPASRDLG